MRIHLKLLSVLLLSYCATAWSASGSVKIGDVSLVIPSPSGLENAEPNAPQLAVQASSFVGKGYRFLMVFVPSKAIAESKAGKNSFSLPRYAIVSSGISGEHVRIQPAEFKRIQDDWQRKAETLIISDIKMKANESSSAKKTGTKLEGLTQPTIISKGLNHISFEYTANVGKDLSTNKILGVTTLLFIKEKLLTVTMYYNPPTEKDRREADNVSTSWVKGILSANGLAQ